MTLSLLPGFAEAFLLAFARIGTLIMLLPGLGERAIPARMRLAAALLITLMALPLVAPSASEASQPVLGRLFIELAIGAILGAAARLVMAAAEMAGVFAAQNIGLAFAQSVDPSQGQQSEVMATFLRMLAAVVIFTADLHHVALAGMFESYRVFPAGAAPATGDAAQLFLTGVGQVFAMAVKLAAPFIAFGILFNLGVGLAGKIAPQLQLFFLTMPASILLGLFILAATLGLFTQQFQLFAGGTLTTLLPP